MKRICFRADASPVMGYGHFVRSLALADMLKQDFDCTFYTQSPSPAQVAAAAQVCPLVALPADETRFGRFLEYLTGKEIVVLDNYFYPTEYQAAIRAKGCRLVCIDDIHDKTFLADALINHGLEDAALYAASPDARLYLGAEWALLRAPFLHPPVVERDLDWVLSFGAADPLDLSLQYARRITEAFPGSSVAVLIGEGYRHPEALEAVPGVQVRRNLPAEEVAALFASSRNVLCSASTVCYEALACGSAVHAGYYIDNQVDFYEMLCRKGLVHPLGDLRQGALPGIQDAGPAGTPLDFRAVAQRFRALFRSLTLDVVNYVDLDEKRSRAVWEARNHPEIRRWMRNPEPFPFEGHQAFVERLKQPGAPLYFAFFEGDTLLGSYDFTDIRPGESAVRGLYVHPDFQRRGVAFMMEYVLEGEIRKQGVHTLLAEVLKFNDRSLACHRSLGYVPCGENDTHYILKREL